MPAPGTYVITWLVNGRVGDVGLRLDAVFGGTKAIDVTTTSVERYKTLRLKENSAPATVNCELASLKRISRLAMSQGMSRGSLSHPPLDLKICQPT